MRKNIFWAIYAILMGLSIYSCSEIVLPKRIGIKGKLDLPIRVGAANLNSLLAEKIANAFSTGAGDDAKVYNVDYEGQTIETFCISIPIKMTEDLNPDHFLKTIDRQLNESGEPKDIIIPMPYTGGSINTKGIELVEGNKIKISLKDISGYVNSIDFARCEGNVLAGIGLSFYVEKTPPELKMKIECDDLNFPKNDYKLLKPGQDVVFGNDAPLTLEPYEYSSSGDELEFTMELQATDGSYDWPPSGVTVEPGMFEIKGRMSFFRVWTKATIDVAKALKASSALGDFGKYPEGAFDLSGLNKYFEGGFTYKDLEVKMYMGGPCYELINRLKVKPKLDLSALYNAKEKKLYYGDLSISPDPINLARYLNENGFYKSRHLPENTSGHDPEIDREVIMDIFKTMPVDLFFKFGILDIDELPVTPNDFNDTDDSGENSGLMTTLMIMLPMSLTATGDNDNKSAISFPDMFGNDDLFGREEPKDLFSKNDIKADPEYIRMTIDFSDNIFTNGCLFINEEKDLFPQGVRLNDRKMVLNFTNEEIEIIKNKLICPNIKIEFDKGGIINIPKNMAIINIQFEMKGLVNIGEP